MAIEESVRRTSSVAVFDVSSRAVFVSAQYESPQARELRQIWDGQTDIQHTVRLLHKKVDEITVRQDTALNQVIIPTRRCHSVCACIPS